MPKKLLALALIAVVTLFQTACNTSEVVTAIEAIATGTVNSLQIAGVLTTAQQTEINTLSTQATADYNAYEQAPAADKATALEKFNTSFKAFSNLVQPLLADVAKNNKVLQVAVGLIIVQIQSVLNIIVTAQSTGANVAATAKFAVVAKKVAPDVKTAAEFKTAYNAAVKPFGKQYQLPTHGTLVHVLTANRVL